MEIQRLKKTHNRKNVYPHENHRQTHLKIALHFNHLKESIHSDKILTIYSSD